MLMTVCSSGLLAAVLWGVMPVAAPMDDVPEECALLLAPTWTIDVTIESLREPEPGEPDGLIAHIQSEAGCEADLVFADAVSTMQVGDMLRVSGATRDGQVIIGKVLRHIRPGTM